MGTEVDIAKLILKGLASPITKESDTHFISVTNEGILCCAAGFAVYALYEDDITNVCRQIIESLERKESYRCLVYRLLDCLPSVIDPIIDAHLRETPALVIANRILTEKSTS